MFAIWATFGAVAGLILAVMILDFCRKQRGQETTPKRLSRRLWNATFGRIKVLRIEPPELYAVYNEDIEKSKAGANNNDSNSSSEEEDRGYKDPSHRPHITVTHPMHPNGSGNSVLPPNIAGPSSLSASRGREHHPSSTLGSMLDPAGPAVLRYGHEHGHGHARRSSHDSTISQQSCERRVAQPIPGRLLVGQQI